MRDRLCELLLNSDPIHERDMDDDLVDGEIEAIADHLLANGVIVPPCKVGDTVYYFASECDKCEEREPYCHRDCKKPTGFTKVNSAVIKRFVICGNQFDGMSDEENTSTFSHIFYFRNIGKTVFLAREEAERALKGMKNER